MATTTSPLQTYSLAYFRAYSCRTLCKTLFVLERLCSLLFRVTLALCFSVVCSQIHCFVG